MVTKLPARLLSYKISSFSSPTIRTSIDDLYKHRKLLSGDQQTILDQDYLFLNIYDREHLTDASVRSLTGTVDRWDEACACSKAGICCDSVTMKGLVDGLQSTCPPSVCSGSWPSPQMVIGEGEETTSTFSTLTGIQTRLLSWTLFDINLSGWQNGGAGAEHEQWFLESHFFSSLFFFVYLPLFFLFTYSTYRCIFNATKAHWLRFWRNHSFS